jgi:flagellar assembly factor FliW
MLLNLESAHAAEGRPIALPSETVVVETRFGTYEFAPDETVMMPHGLVGFAEHQLFGLGNLPAPVPEDFKLLQSLDEVPVSFIVMPSTADEAPIEPGDLDEACAASGLERGEAHLLFICTLRPKAEGAGVEMSVNLRAPIVFSLESRVARQHVFQNDRYPLCQTLDRWDGVL